MSLNHRSLSHSRLTSSRRLLPALPRDITRSAPLSKRARGGKPDVLLPYTPPEDWHEPMEDHRGFRVVVQHAGSGFRHVVTPQEVRDRLAELPEELTAPLQVVQFSRVTRKKASFPCYGMQWGATIYLYPMEAGLVEQYERTPRPSQFNEARMYGGRWEQNGRQWRLIWSEQAIKDFYLNNILIHELGHLLDERNSNSVDRERYAEWFAIRYGYTPTSAWRESRLGRKQVVKRHHAK